MARNKLKVAIFVILVSPVVLKGQCDKVKEEEINYIVFPKVFFSSNADQVKRFISSNDLIDKSHGESENHASDVVMTSSQDSSLFTLSDESTASLDVQESTRAVSSPGVSTEPVSDVTHWNNGSYIFVHTKQMTWEEAKDECSTMGEGTHLVFIESELENREVSRLAKAAANGQNKDWWIGLTDKETEGTWKWYNMTTSYTNWGTNQPNDFGSDEDCGELKVRHGDSALWNDDSCNKEQHFICEKDVNSPA